MYQKRVLRFFNYDFLRIAIRELQNAMYVGFAKNFANPTYSLFANHKLRFANKEYLPIHPYGLGGP